MTGDPPRRRDPASDSVVDVPTGDPAVDTVVDAPTGDPAVDSVVDAPAKLTLTLRVVGRRADGYHEIDAEMVSVDLFDTLRFAVGDGLVVDWEDPATSCTDLSRRQLVESGGSNLVNRALALSGRRAAVRLTKRIPPGAGLGGGSADAGAVLRWSGLRDNRSAVTLGSDVPFCAVGGRARVRGIGERVDPLAFEERRFVLLLAPFSMDTGAVYRAWDGIERQRQEHLAGGSPRSDAHGAEGNDLQAAACQVEPALVWWRDAMRSVVGAEPRLAGSGSTWFVELPSRHGSKGLPRVVEVRGQQGEIVEVRTVPAELG
jgi:4-diphosphocytidyl-2-C-methyl-D-erythritol kinase